MSGKQKSAAVIGGGIGGACAALHLLRAGFDVHVYEQSEALREVGAGINITPNASRVLHGIGLADALEKIAVKPSAWLQHRWQDGRLLLRTPLGPHFGFPQYQVHRGDLLAMLVNALPPERVHPAHRLARLVDHGDKVEAQFENGARAVADVLIGADGIHSTVRRELFGESAPRFTGAIAYRGLVPAEKIAHLDLEVAAQMWLGPGSHFVMYFVSGGRLLNFVAHLDRDAWTKESWNERGDPAQLRAEYAGWEPRVRAVVDCVEETFIWGLFDRVPMKQWSRGRITLLGDACHPMLPYMAQGAAQAMEDGVCLTACLEQAGDVVAALARYETLRQPRTAYIQTHAAANKTRFHLPDGPAQIERDAKMAAGGIDWSQTTTDWLFGYDPAEAARTGERGLPPGL